MTTVLTLTQPRFVIMGSFQCANDNNITLAVSLSPFIPWNHQLQFRLFRTKAKWMAQFLLCARVFLFFWNTMDRLGTDDNNNAARNVIQTSWCVCVCLGMTILIWPSLNSLYSVLCACAICVSAGHLFSFLRRTLTTFFFIIFLMFVVPVVLDAGVCDFFLVRPIPLYTAAGDQHDYYFLLISNLLLP